MPNKHEGRTVETRRGLLKSARLIFARDGFEACRIEDIAAAAGRTRGAFYAHFETKAELFFALLQEEVDKHARRIRTVLEGRQTVEDRLAALRDYYARCMADREWGMLVLEFKLFAARHPRLRPQLTAIHRRIRASMKLEVIYKLLGIDKTDNEPRGAALEGVMAGLFLEQAYDPERLSERHAAVFLGHIFDSLLSTKRAGD
jgi:AcrR family transcriptional regulator